MNILEFDFNTDYGFVWIVIDGKNEGDKWTIQCCLKPEKNAELKIQKGKKFRYIKVIDCGDCGHNFATCADVNEEAFDYWGQNRCMVALFNCAKKNGIKTIGF